MSQIEHLNTEEYNVNENQEDIHNLIDHLTEPKNKIPTAQNPLIKSKLPIEEDYDHEEALRMINELEMQTTK